MKKGISLVALVITIIVLIILTATAIIMYNKGEILTKTEEAVFKNDFKKIHESFMSMKISYKIKKHEIYNKNITNPEEILAEIPLLKENNKTISGYQYAELIQIIDGTIYQSDVISSDESEKEIEISKWLNDVGINKLEIILEPGLYNINGELVVEWNPEWNNDYSKIVEDMEEGSTYKLVIQDGIKKINDNTFKNFNRFYEIVLPKSLTSIGNYAFYGCSSLTKITIPEGVTSIGHNVFRECTSLKK